MREVLAATRVAAQVPAGLQPLPESIRQVLDSRTFERAPTLRTLLTYLWHNRDQAISEYAIATEAMGRSPAFDAKTDATVRVQISRLRQRLEKFYEQEGKTCAERVVIPLGAHTIKLEPVTVPVPLQQPALHAVVLPRRSANHRLVWACAALSVLSAGLGIALFQSRHRPRPAVDPPPRFWKAFVGEGRPTRIILPTPVFFSYSRADISSVMVRDTSINDFSDRDRAPLLGELGKSMGTPQLAQNYTVTSDTFASVSLVRYLDGFALPSRLRSSADAPLEALDSENVIAIGTWGTLTPLKTYLDQMSLRLGPHELSIGVRNPAPGEPKTVNMVPESPERGIWPGVVAVLPARGGKTHLLVLVSRHTSALVATLTSRNGLDQVERLWRSKGSPEFFEMAMNSEMNGSDLVRSWPVLLRPFRPAGAVTPRN
jgi:hypothetical protein